MLEFYFELFIKADANTCFLWPCSNVYVTKAARKVIPALLRRLQLAANDEVHRAHQVTEHTLFAISSMVRTDHRTISDLISHGAGAIFR